jgi:hypothetical protein
MTVRLLQLLLKRFTGNWSRFEIILNELLLKNLILLIFEQCFSACSSRKLFNIRVPALPSKAVQSSSVMEGFTSSPSTLFKCCDGMRILSALLLLEAAIMDKNRTAIGLATNNELVQIHGDHVYEIAFSSEIAILGGRNRVFKEV